MTNELTLRLEIPAGFQQACESLHTDPQRALQTLVNHLSFYSQLASPGNDPHSLAGIVVREYLDSRGLTPAPNPKTREVNIRYTKEVLAIIRTPMSAAKRKKRYEQIVDNWYRDLQLVNP